MYATLDTPSTSFTLLTSAGHLESAHAHEATALTIPEKSCSNTGEQDFTPIPTREYLQRPPQAFRWNSSVPQSEQQRAYVATSPPQT